MTPRDCGITTCRLYAQRFIMPANSCLICTRRSCRNAKADLSNADALSGSNTGSRNSENVHFVLQTGETLRNVVGIHYEYDHTPCRAIHLTPQRVRTLISPQSSPDSRRVRTSKKILYLSNYYPLFVGRQAEC